MGILISKSTGNDELQMLPHNRKSYFSFLQLAAKIQSNDGSKWLTENWDCDVSLSVYKTYGLLSKAPGNRFTSFEIALIIVWRAVTRGSTDEKGGAVT